MIEILDSNPWHDHLEALERVLQRSERRTEHLRQQYVDDLDKAQIWQREANEETIRDLAKAEDPRHEPGADWFPPPGSNNEP